MPGAMQSDDVTFGYNYQSTNTGTSGYGWLMGASALMGGMASFSAGLAAKEHNRAKQALNESQRAINKELVKVKKRDLENRTLNQLRRHRIKVNQTIGAQRAALASQGIDLESGSALDLQMDTAWIGAQDEITIRTNSWKEAFGYDVQELSQDAKIAFSNLSLSADSRQSLLAGTTGFSRGALESYAYMSRY